MQNTEICNKIYSVKSDSVKFYSVKSDSVKSDSVNSDSVKSDSVNYAFCQLWFCQLRILSTLILSTTHSVNSDSVNYAFCQLRILSTLILSTKHSVKSDSVNYAFCQIWFCQVWFCQVRILSTLILSTTHSVKYASVNSVLSSRILSNPEEPQIVAIQNLNCPKNAKTHAQTWFLSPLYQVKLCRLCWLQVNEEVAQSVFCSIYFSAWKSLLKVATLVHNALMSPHAHVKERPPDLARVKQSALTPQAGLKSVQVGH